MEADLPTRFTAYVDGDGRVTIPERCRRFLDIEEGGATVAVSVARTPAGLLGDTNHDFITGEP